MRFRSESREAWLGSELSHTIGSSAKAWEAPPSFVSRFRRPVVIMSPPLVHGFWVQQREREIWHFLFPTMIHLPGQALFHCAAVAFVEGGERERSACIEGGEGKDDAPCLLLTAPAASRGEAGDKRRKDPPSYSREEPRRQIIPPFAKNIIDTF